MASDVDVCNMALSLLGSEAAVVSLSPPDGSAEAGHCKRFFALARRQALEMSAFSWTKKRAAMASVTNPSDVWGYAYQLPGDCITPLRVLQKNIFDSGVLDSFTGRIVTADELRTMTEAMGAEFQIEGDIILTHEPEAVLLYARDITDLTRASAAFISGFSYLLASYIAGPIIKGKEGAAAGRELRDAARSVLTDAAVQDVPPGSESQDFMPDSIRARG
jgi:hypothetical protein